MARALRVLMEQPFQVLTLDLKSVDCVDVTFFQLLIAFRRSWTKRERQLVVLHLAENHPVLAGAHLLGLSSSVTGAGESLL